MSPSERCLQQTGGTRHSCHYPMRHPRCGPFRTAFPQDMCKYAASLALRNAETIGVKATCDRGNCTSAAIRVTVISIKHSEGARSSAYSFSVPLRHCRHVHQPLTTQAWQKNPLCRLAAVLAVQTGTTTVCTFVQSQASPGQNGASNGLAVPDNSSQGQTPSTAGPPPSNQQPPSGGPPPDGGLAPVPSPPAKPAPAPKAQPSPPLEPAPGAPPPVSSSPEPQGRPQPPPPVPQPSPAPSPVRGSLHKSPSHTVC